MIAIVTMKKIICIINEVVIIFILNTMKQITNHRGKNNTEKMKYLR